MPTASADTLSATDDPTDASVKPRRRDLHEPERRALESILAALATGVRCILLTGARGSGQSSILDVAAAAVESETTQVLRVDPGGTGRSDPRLLCLILGGSDGPGASNAIKQAQLLLLYPPAPQTRTVLLIDNAHLLERHALVQLHLTSALQGKDTAQLQIVFAAETTSESSLNAALLRQLEGSDGIRVKLEATPQRPYPPPRGPDFRSAHRPPTDISGGERASKPASAFAKAGPVNPFASANPSSKPRPAAERDPAAVAFAEKPSNVARAKPDVSPVDFGVKSTSERTQAAPAVPPIPASVAEQPSKPRGPDVRPANGPSTDISAAGEKASEPSPAFAKAGAVSASASAQPSRGPPGAAERDSAAAAVGEKRSDVPRVSPEVSPVDFGVQSPSGRTQAAPAAHPSRASVSEASAQHSPLYTPSEFRDPPDSAGTRRTGFLIWACLLAGIAIVVPLKFLLRDGNIRPEPAPRAGSQAETRTTTGAAATDAGLTGSQAMPQSGGSETTHRAGPRRSTASFWPAPSQADTSIAPPARLDRSPAEQRTPSARSIEGSGTAVAAGSEVSIPLPRLSAGPGSPSASTASGSARPSEARVEPSVPAANTGVRLPPEPPNSAPLEGKYAAGPAWPGAPLRGGQPLYWGPATAPSPGATGQSVPAPTTAPAPATNSAAGAAVGSVAPALGDSPALVEWLITWGDDAWRLGDVANARSLYARAAAAGSGKAAIAMGRTFDPRFLGAIHTRRIEPDPASAITWYKRAASLGDPSAGRLLAGLVAGALH